MIERRFIHGGQLRSSKGGEKPQIAGVASVYNQQYDTGWMVETIKPGAFNKVLGAAPDVRCLFNHDANNLLARTKSGTLRLSDAHDGLHFEADMDPESRVGADVQRMIERGDLDGCSFSFSVGKQSWREEKDEAGNWVYCRDIEEFEELFDVGPVTFPAYTGTSVGARAEMRSLWPDGVPEDVRTHVPKLREEVEKKAAAEGTRPGPSGRDGDMEACSCTCGNCQAGDCSQCSDADCDDPNCICEYSARGLLLRARAHVMAALPAGNC